ncbi:hypothetical protein [Streptomyces sp. NPDC004250]|uniref:hypothetical protein n=1 Tax=Streptomyces sp. NPDC004250 TaxID=3364692 RepID=UPI0036B425EE
MAESTFVPPWVIVRVADLEKRRLKEVVDHSPGRLSARVHDFDVVLDLDIREARHTTTPEASGLAMHISGTRHHSDTTGRSFLTDEGDAPPVDVFENGPQPTEVATQPFVLTVDELLVLGIEPQQLHEGVQALGTLSSQTLQFEVQRVPWVADDHGGHHLRWALFVGVPTRCPPVENHLGTAVQEPDGLGKSGSG